MALLSGEPGLGRPRRSWVELPAEGQFSKTLRDASGAPGPALRPPPLGPGDFARQMIETSELLTFL